ncbi:histone-lysine N-methyltransferase SETMAR [Trichonephila clavipes]|nr:histone-lysine N-methyltransferase SETMAR [Trichonephila clavipes]
MQQLLPKTQVYPSALDVRKCQRRFSKFRSGNFDLSDSHRSGRPTTLDNDVIKRASGRKSVSDNRGTVKCSYNQPWSNIHEHLQQIGKTNRAGVWVPHNLSEENRANRSTTCNLLLQQYNTEPFFDRLITADEKWVLYDNPIRKRQWLFPNEPPRRTVACLVTSSSPVPLKTRRVGQRCPLNLSRVETSSRWCGVVVRRGGYQLRCRPRHLTMVQNYMVRRQKPLCS